MFLKTNTPPAVPSKPAKPAVKKDNTTISIVTRDLNILGNIISEGNIDFDGLLEGNVRCHMLTIRAHGIIKGEVSAEAVYVYGKIKGLIRAKVVHLYTGCTVEGTIMHESITIEDGAVVDGKMKRTDRVSSEDSDEGGTEIIEPTAAEGMKILENIRLIR